MKYDYIWRQHPKTSNYCIKFNQRIVADGEIDGEDMYVTLMDIK